MPEDNGVRKRGAGEQKANGGAREDKKPERAKPFQGRYNPKVSPMTTNTDLWVKLKIVHCIETE